MAERERAGYKAQAEERGDALEVVARKLHHTEEHYLAFDDCYAMPCQQARAAIAITPEEAREKEGR